MNAKHKRCSFSYIQLHTRDFFPKSSLSWNDLIFVHKLLNKNKSNTLSYQKQPTVKTFFLLIPQKFRILWLLFGFFFRFFDKDNFHLLQAKFQTIWENKVRLYFLFLFLSTTNSRFYSIFPVEILWYFQSRTSTHLIIDRIANNFLKPRKYF